MSPNEEACAPDPPACSLSPSALQQRLGEWRSLTAQALTRETGPGWVRATYPNRPDIAARLDGLIAAESECCPHLEFDVHARDGVLQVDLRLDTGMTPR